MYISSASCVRNVLYVQWKSNGFTQCMWHTQHEAKSQTVNICVFFRHRCNKWMNPSFFFSLFLYVHSLVRIRRSTILTSEHTERKAELISKNNTVLCHYIDGEAAKEGQSWMRELPSINKKMLCNLNECVLQFGKVYQKSYGFIFNRIAEWISQKPHWALSQNESGSCI